MKIMTLLDYFDFQNHLWLSISVFASISVLVSTFADRRRQRRSNINNVGFVPWTAITVFSVLLAVVSAALAIKLA